MMKKILLIASLLCTGAQAQFFTGNDLLTRLNSDSGIDRSLGTGFIMGVYDATHSITHCPPENVTVGQVKDMVLKNLNRGAEARHLAAEAFVSYTLNSAWPCPKKSKGRDI